MSAQVLSPPTLGSGDTERAGVLAATNYGLQIAYNHGSVSNYFCFSSDVAHECHFPEISSKSDSLDKHIYKRIQKARELYNTKRWVSAKPLFQEALNAPYATLVATERIQLQYNLAHTHFALAEFDDAARQFQDVLDIHQERNEAPEQTVNDSRYWLARSFYHLERHADASKELQHFVRTHDQKDTHGVEQVTTARLWLGLTFERLSQYSLAKEQLVSAFETQAQNLGPENLKTLACRHHLANFMYKRKAYPEAQEHFQALLLVEDNLSGPEKEEATRTRSMLAFCLAKIGSYEEAEPHLRRVLARMDSLRYLSYEEVRDTGLVCYWLGRVAFNKKNELSVTEAGHLFQRALKMISDSINHPRKSMREHVGQEYRRGNIVKEKNHDDDLQDELTGCRCYQAHTMRLQRQFVAAEQAYRQILNTSSVTGQDYLIASRHGLSRSLIEQKKFSEAKSVLEEVVSVTTPLEGCRHTGDDLGACMDALGQIHLRLKQHSQARDCFQRVVDVTPEEPTRAYSQSRCSLGMALFRLRQFENAHSHFEYAYQFEMKNNREYLLQTECWLSWSLCEVGKYSEAEAHLRPVFTILQNSTISRESDHWLGLSHFYKGRAAIHRHNVAEAIKHLRMAQAMIARCAGLDNPTYLECRYQLAYSLFSQNQIDEARLIFEELQNIPEDLEEPSQNIRLVSAPYWLGRISFWQNKASEALDYYTKCLEHIHGDKLPFHMNISIESVRLSRAKSLHLLGRDDECSEILRGILAEENNPCTEQDRIPLYQASRVWLGRSLHGAKRYAEAYDYLSSTVLDLESKRGFDDSDTSTSRVLLVDCLSELGRHDEAAPHLTRLRTVQTATPMNKAIANYWLGRRSFRNSQLVLAEGFFNDAQKWNGLKNTKWKHMKMDCQHFLARIQLRDKKYIHADEVLMELARQQYESGDIAHAVDNQYCLGRSLYLQHKYNTAIPVFEKITNDNKVGRIEEYSVSASYQSMGHCLYSQQKFKEAKSHYELALQFLNTDYAKFISRFYIAHCDFKMGSYEEAKELYQSCLEQIANSPESITKVQFWLGKTFFELRDWVKSDTYLSSAVFADLKPLSDTEALEARCSIGRARIAAKNFSDAVHPLLSIHSKFSETKPPAYLLCRYYLSLAQYELGQFKKSRRTLLQLQTHYREQKSASNSTSDVLAVNFLIARCLVGLNVNIKAETELGRITNIAWYKLCAKSSDQTIMLAEYDLARIAYRTGHYSRAAELFQEALLKRETVHVDDCSLDRVQCQRYLALTFQALQQTEEASQFYHKVLDSQASGTEQAPHHSLLDVQICLSRTLYSLEKRPNCEEITEEAGNWPGTLSGSSHPYKVRQQILLADLAFRLQDFQRAEQTYASLLALMESSKEARKMTPIPVRYLHTVFAVTLSKLNNIQEARIHVLKALEADCAHAHSCTSVDGFTEAFLDLLPDNWSTSCPVHATAIKANTERHVLENKYLAPQDNSQGKETEIQASHGDTSQTQGPGQSKQKCRITDRKTPKPEQQDEQEQSSSVQTPISGEIRNNGELSRYDNKHTSPLAMVLRAEGTKRAPPRPKPKPAHLQRKIPS
ncbi:hypothetical protein N0V90_007531 [Kalmusia sp. IMI 367209]|nr:hypothetical protein N0V90_007531 [Kalmusia sp. IMI 367209]